MDQIAIQLPRMQEERGIHGNALDVIASGRRTFLLMIIYMLKTRPLSLFNILAPSLVVESLWILCFKQQRKPASKTTVMVSATNVRIRPRPGRPGHFHYSCTVVKNS
jgi:hypothetical protein